MMMIATEITQLNLITLSIRKPNQHYITTVGYSTLLMSNPLNPSSYTQLCDTIYGSAGDILAILAEYQEWVITIIRTMKRTSAFSLF